MRMLLSSGGNGSRAFRKDVGRPGNSTGERCYSQPGVNRPNPTVTQTLLSDASLGSWGRQNWPPVKTRRNPHVSQESRAADTSTSRWHAVMRKGLGHRVISTTDGAFSSNNDCFKLTPSISHLSVYFLLGTFVSSSGDFKLSPHKESHYTHFTHRETKALMGQWISGVVPARSSRTTPCLPGWPPESICCSANPQSSPFLYTTHTSIYLTRSPKPRATHFQRGTFSLPPQGGQRAQRAAWLVCFQTGSQVVRLLSSSLQR